MILTQYKRMIIDFVILTKISVVLWNEHNIERWAHFA